MQAPNIAFPEYQRDELVDALGLGYLHSGHLADHSNSNRFPPHVHEANRRQMDLFNVWEEEIIPP